MTNMKNPSNAEAPTRAGWASWLAKISMAALLFESISGLAITLLPFHASVQWSVLVHTVVGALALVPLAWYLAYHWLDYRRYTFSHVILLGYAGLLALVICLLSGIVVTWEGLFGLRSSVAWRKIHLISTLVTLGTVLPHLIYAFLRVWREAPNPARGYFVRVGALTVVALIPIGGLTWAYAGARYVNKFPQDYNFLYGTNRPFAPSLARTDTGGAFDAESLAGSRSCGTAGCHEQIVQEWVPSAHRYAAMDPAFQGIQEVMAKQNGAESTRYCAGCHDPISLFSGTKNLFVKDLTSLHGYQEGVSCLACHAIRETDIKGNASYVVTQPREYLWQWQDRGASKLVRDFLIRTYPEEHNKLAKRAFKKPEYCAACHKQFIDQEVNRVGWVQLQNQFDNWSASNWNHKGDARKTVECRECHMPLVASTDPAAGDSADYNRQPGDAKHRSHRFLGANQMIPNVLKLEGAAEHTRMVEHWLQGKIEVPEIRDKWKDGAIVRLALNVPESIAPGEPIPMKVVLASNKVGHDFPTGPLDIIQSWLEVRVADASGREVYSSGKRDAKNFIEPGAFLFKAEPVDQHGNLIDRHNLWEMVGVRYRRALFPGYSDAVEYSMQCSAAMVKQPGAAGPDQREEKLNVPPIADPGQYHITVILQYRKVDQYLLNYLFGENKLTAPVTELTRATATVRVKSKTTTSNSPNPSLARSAIATR